MDVSRRDLLKLLAVAAGAGLAPESLEAALAALEPERDRAVRIVARRGATARTARWLAARRFEQDSIEAAIEGIADDERLELG